MYCEEHVDGSIDPLTVPIRSLRSLLRNDNHRLSTRPADRSLLRYMTSLTDSTTVAPPVPLTPRQMAMASVRTAFREENATLGDLTAARIMVVWRLTRELCRHLGLTEPGLTTAQSLDRAEPSPDPWVTPSGRRFLNSRCSMPVLSLLDKARSLPQAQAFPRAAFPNAILPAQTPTHPDWVPVSGLAVLPPDPPSHHTFTDGTLSPEYDPDEDRLLLHYISVVHRLCDELDIASGSPTDPDYGRHGLWGITDPCIIRTAWPSRIQIVAFEEFLIEEIQYLLTDDTPLVVRKKLRDKYGLQSHEIEDVVKMALGVMQNALNFSPEEYRSIMMLRLEGFLVRCRSAFDLRNELGGLKQLCQVLGMTQGEKDDVMGDFVKIVKSASEQRSRPLLQAEFRPKELD